MYVKIIELIEQHQRRRLEIEREQQLEELLEQEKGKFSQDEVRRLPISAESARTFSASREFSAASCSASFASFSLRSVAACSSTQARSRLSPDATARPSVAHRQQIL